MDNDARISGSESETDIWKSVGTCFESRLSLENSPQQPSQTSDDRDSSSDFGDGACGEPFVAQHLIIDFTPDEELDTEEVQKKCCDFWEFINSHPELKHLCVMPEKTEFLNMPDEFAESDSSAPRAEVAPEPMDKTAVSMLSLVEHKGLIDRAFEPKICQSHCTLGPREYVEHDPNKPVPLKQCVCTCAEPCIEPCKPGQVTLDPPAPDQRPDVRALCHTMQEWNVKHPKSMESPGPSPDLIHAVMQRKIEPFC